MADHMLWSALEFAKWFQEQGASKQVQAAVVLQDLSGEVASAIDDATLAHIGVESPEERAALLAALQQLIAQAESIPEPAGQAYYYNQLSQELADAALAGRPQGDYLVRDADVGFGFIISAVQDSIVAHTAIPYDAERRLFILADGTEYGSFRSVLDAYLSASMIIRAVEDASAKSKIGAIPLVILSENLIQRVPMSQDPAGHPYFHGDLSSGAAATKLMAAGIDGSFIVWRGPNGFVLSFNTSQNPMHILIVRGHDGSLNIKSGDEYVRHANFQELLFYWWQTKVLRCYIPAENTQPSAAPVPVAAPAPVANRVKAFESSSEDEDLSSGEEVVYGSFTQFVEQSSQAEVPASKKGVAFMEQETEVITYGAIPREVRAGVRLLSAGGSSGEDSDGGDTDKVIVYGAVPRTARDIQTLREVDREKSKRRRRRKRKDGQGTNRPTRREKRGSSGPHGQRRRRRRRRTPTIEGAKHPRMRDLEVRLNSTVPRVSGNSAGIGWPHPKPSNEQIARAGFYFSATGSKLYKVTDMVVCFACGVKLYNWQPGEDIVERHRVSRGDCPIFKEPNPADISHIGRPFGAPRSRKSESSRKLDSEGRRRRGDGSSKKGGSDSPRPRRGDKAEAQSTPTMTRKEKRLSVKLAKKDAKEAKAKEKEAAKLAKKKK